MNCENKKKRLFSFLLDKQKTTSVSSWSLQSAHEYRFWAVLFFLLLVEKGGKQAKKKKGATKKKVLTSVARFGSMRKKKKDGKS